MSSEESRIRMSHMAARKLLSSLLGIDLPSFVVVHHIDGNPFNNTLTNLQIVTAEEHTKLHQREYRQNRKATIGKILPKGITYDAVRGDFKCSIRVGPKRYQSRIGTLEDAIEWRRLMEEIFWEGDSNVIR
jgi:hypothetical protein